MKSDPRESRHIRVFLSSTFADMTAERDEIVKLFNHLRIVAARRNVMLSLIDLRWGITDDAVRNGHAVSICMQEIDNSRPFLIGLIGDRYGWQPTADELSLYGELLERFPVIRDYVVRSLSITDMEMRYGALDTTDKVEGAFFLKNGVRPENELHRKLIESVRQSRFPLHNYSSLRQLVKDIESEFMKMLDRYFPKRRLTYLESERLRQHAVIRSKCNIFVKNPLDMDRLDRWLTSGSRHLAIIAPSGMGKSATVANWISCHQGTEHIIAHFLEQVGDSPDTILHHLIAEFRDLYGIRPSLFRNYESPQKELESVLSQVAGSQRQTIVVIDGLNQLPSSGNARLLNWLPAFPSNVRLIVSTVPGDATADAVTGRRFETFSILPMDTNRRMSLIHGYLQRVGKELDIHQAFRIAYDAESGNPMILRTLLDDLITYGNHETLEATIDTYLAARSYQEFFDIVLRNAEDFYGHDLVADTLTLIALSEAGLSESDLAALLDFNKLDWSAFYCGFYAHLATHGGLLTFSHSFIRQAVTARYIDKAPAYSIDDKRRMIVNMVTDYYEGLPRYFNEITYQYLCLKADTSLHYELLDLRLTNYLTTSNPTRLAECWRFVLSTDSAYSVLDYLKHGRPTRDIPAYSNGLGVFILYYLSMPREAAEFFLMSERHIRNNPRLTRSQKRQSLAAAYGNLSQCHLLTAHYDEAIDSLTRGFDIIDGHNSPPDIQIRIKILNDAGMIYKNTGRYDKALYYLEEAVKICRGADITTLCNLYVNYSSVLFALGHVSRAIQLAEWALDNTISSVGKRTPQALSAMTLLASFHAHAGDPARSTELLKQALRTYNDIVSPDSYESLTIAISLSTVLLDSGKANQAYDMLMENLPWAQGHLCTEHHLLANLYYTLGIACLRLNRPDEATHYQEKALPIFSQLHGDDSVSVAMTLGELGKNLAEHGQFDKALTSFQRALEIYRNQVGDNHQDTAAIYSSVGSVLVDLKRYDEALPYCEKSIRITSSILGPKHKHLVPALRCIGQIMESRDNQEKAVDYYTRALEIGLESDSDNPEIPICYVNLGTIYADMGRKWKGLEYYFKAKDFYLRLFDEHYPPLIPIYDNIVQIYHDIGDMASALYNLEKISAIKKKHCGENDPEYIETLYVLGVGYLNIGDRTRAADYLQSAFDLCSHHLGPNNPLTIAIDAILRQIKNT